MRSLGALTNLSSSAVSPPPPSTVVTTSATTINTATSTSSKDTCPKCGDTLSTSHRSDTGSYLCTTSAQSHLVAPSFLSRTHNCKACREPSSTWIHPRCNTFKVLSSKTLGQTCAACHKNFLLTTEEYHPNAQWIERRYAHIVCPVHIIDNVSGSHVEHVCWECGEKEVLPPFCASLCMIQYVYPDSKKHSIHVGCDPVVFDNLEEDLKCGECHDPISLVLRNDDDYLLERGCVRVAHNVFHRLCLLAKRK